MPKKKQDHADEALCDARYEVIDALPAIVRKLIEKAKEGSYQHAKFLFDFASSGGGHDAGNSADDNSLAAFLMKELKEEPSA
jgi:hypothetical protein